MLVCTEFVLLPFTHLLRNVSSSWDEKPWLFWDAQLREELERVVRPLCQRGVCLQHQ